MTIRQEESPPAWTPDTSALDRTVWTDPSDGRPTTILLRHPTAPFVERLDADDDRELQACAHRYLMQANELAALGLPAQWLAALDVTAGPDPEFGWLPLDRPSHDAPPDPAASFRFSRRHNESLIDTTVVLLASERLDDVLLGSEFGIRIVAHVRPDPGRGDEVRITSMSASLPFGEYWSEGPSDQFWPQADKGRLYERLGELVTIVAATLRLQPETAVIRGFRLGRIGKPERAFEARGRALGIVDPERPMESPAYEFLVSGTISQDLGSIQATFMEKVPLNAAAQPGDARLFPRDPLSQRRPNRVWKRRPGRRERARDGVASLDTYRDLESIAGTQDVNLEVPGRLQIVQTWFVQGDEPAQGVKKVSLPGNGPPIRSNDFSAVSAYRHLGQLFERMDIYRIDPAAYFRGAALPVKGVYRSGVRPGPGKDGQTINACVTPDGWRPGNVASQAAGERPVLRVHLALGDLSHRGRRTWDGTNRSTAEPLGIAADARWVWHEIGHILLMASVGELEFRFAHSPGDALAAIVADPASSLVRKLEWRGATFPWVFEPRRHDRCVLHGWSWSGSFHRAVAGLPDALRLRRKGYRSEQILSSSLFRLYRCLGGDTVDDGSSDPDRDTRRAASHYAIYLIMKGLGLLGDARFAPANRADQFAAALIEADIGTETFTLPVGDNGAVILPRTGGSAHKLIRWAFEAQGMYAPPGAVNNAPGSPEAVDIYIADRRPAVETTPAAPVAHGPGSYVPVSLDWDGTPRWFATGAAMDRQRDQMYVTVNNRGRQVANGVTVTLLSRLWPQGAPPPLWERAQWNAGASTLPAQNVNPGQAVRFGPFALPTAAGRHLVLAEATCAGDRANSDPLSNLPCSRLPTPLPDLVGGDNNLGLRIVEIP